MLAVALQLEVRPGRAEPTKIAGVEIPPMGCPLYRCDNQECRHRYSNLDPDGPLMNKVRDTFEIKQRQVQMVGLTESEMLQKEWQGNRQGMQKGH